MADPPRTPREAGGCARRRAAEPDPRWHVVGALLVVLRSSSFFVTHRRSSTCRFVNTLPIALIGLPMTMLVVSGEIDLSVGSTVGLSGAVMGSLWNAGLSIQVIIVICLLLGVVCGLVNGLLVTRLSDRPRSP